MGTRLTVQILELNHAGMGADEIASVLGVSIETVYHSLTVDLENYNDSRSTDVITMYRDGETLAGIGEKYGLTRERIRQIIWKQAARESGYYGVQSQKDHREVIGVYIRETVEANRAERILGRTNERIEEARRQGIEPEYFNSLRKYCEATNIYPEHLKDYRRDIYDMIKLAEQRKKQRWNEHYDECVLCGTTSVKHRSHGMCLNCYYKSDEFREIQRAAYYNNLEKRKIANREYAQRPDVRRRISEKTSEAYFDGNWRKTLDRDNWECRGCGLKYGETFTAAGASKVKVWRVNKKKDDNRLENLISACQSCYKLRLDSMVKAIK